MTLWQYILRRILSTLPTLFGALVIMFILTRILPGDPVLMVLGPAHSSPENVEQMRKVMGIDQPLPVQFVRYLGQLMRGDLGYSWHTGNPVSKELIMRFPATFELTSLALILMVVFGLPLGIVAGYYRNKTPDNIINGITVMGISMPSFWLGLLLIILFVVALNWLPPGGRVAFLEDPGTAWRYLLMPVLTLSVRASGIFIRFTRTSMLEVLPEDYVRTARAKGLPESLVVARHALRCALIPVVTVVGLEFGRLLVGAVIAEQIFAWPGVGRLIIQAVGQRDYVIVQGVLLLLVIVFVLVNLITDLLYGVLDPRIRLVGESR